MNQFILGPSIDQVDEPAVAPLPVGKVGLNFGSPASEPGAKVNLVLADVNADPANCPINVWVYYVPKGTEPPPGDLRTPAWFQGCGCKQVAAPVPTVRPATQFSTQVPGVVPGPYFVQTVLEYAG